MKRYLVSLFVLTTAFSAYGQGGSNVSKAKNIDNHIEVDKERPVLASPVNNRLKSELLVEMPDSEKSIFTIKDASGKNITVYADEFKRQFLKNANLRQKPATEADIQEHLDLYIKFKMKVLDAQLAGLDTNKAYLKELGMYRDQLAKNFLYDRNVTDALIKEAYERLKYEVKVSHILILASPDDNEQKHKAAKDRIDGIYRKLMRNPSAQNFADLAKQESEDPGSSNAGGSLGYMTAMQVVYEFENYAYNTPVGAISTVFKTDFGYHILRVEDKRLNRGDIKMNHIMIRVNGKEEGSEAEAKKRIDDIYNKIISGAETFPSMAQNYSEDYSSRYNNGALDFVRVTQFLGDVDKQNWVDQGFALAKDGDISKPFRTNGGWHILQRMSVKPLGSYDQMKNYLKNEVQKDSRSKVSVDSLVSKIKLANNFRLNALAVSALKINLDTNFLKGKFDANTLPKVIDVVTGSGKTKKVTKYELQSLQLFKLEASTATSADKLAIFEEYEVSDFVDYIEKNNRAHGGSVSEAVDALLNEWISKLVIEYQDKNLEYFNADFRDIYQEYREGILMFNRMQEVVWMRANTDSAGLAEFFASQKGVYRWGNRVDGEFYFCKDEKMAKTVMKQLKKGIALDSIRRFNTKGSALDFSYKIGKYERSDSFLFKPSSALLTVFNDIENNVKPKFAKPGIYSVGLIGSQFVVFKNRAFLPAMDKSLDETRGPVSSKYQEKLEKDWLAALKTRFKTDINANYLQQVTTELVGK